MQFLVLCTVCVVILVSDTTARYSGSSWLVQHNATVREELSRYAQMLDAEHQTVQAEFPCKVMSPSPSVPTSVHKLRPGDIQVIAGVGDSLTAGKGIKASTIFGLLTDNRGLAWSIGGDGTFEDHLTLPNILKKYNPGLKGFSVKSGNRDSENAHLNVADSGATSDQLAGQINLLVERLKSEEGIDFNNDWKVITVLIGGNDLCQSCKDGSRYTADDYMSHLQSGLDILHQQVPRVFVNLVEPMNMEVVKSLNEGLVCSILHRVGCSCAAFPENAEAEKALIALTKEYQARIYELVETGRYDTRDDFTVVVQPFFHDTFLPMKDGKPDMSYFAPDCFHIREKGHHALAEALWNNMLEAPGRKLTKWVSTEPFECPTEQNPYFATYNNSRRLSSSGNSENQITHGGRSAVGVEKQEVCDDGNQTSVTRHVAVVVSAFLLLTLVGVALMGLWARYKHRHVRNSKDMHAKDVLLWENSPKYVLDDDDDDDDDDMEILFTMRCSFVVLLTCLVAVRSWTYEEYSRFVYRLAANQTIQREFSKHAALFRPGVQPDVAEFPCKPLSPSNSIPTSVHRLRPGDINVVAAIGDSITAGTGITALTIIGLLRQDRGLSWSIGAQVDYEKQPTLPSILKKYNPNLKGYATGSGGVKSKRAHLDLAKPGAKSEAMYQQARDLVDRMKKDETIDFKKDWKVITVFIGGNDLCDFCEDKNKFSPQHYTDNLRKTLDLFYAEVPRAFVNLVEVLHVDIANQLNIGIICPIMHFFLCKCAAFPKNGKAENELLAAISTYQQSSADLVNGGRYDGRDDFTVVVQPFFEKTTLPMKPGTDKPDLEYFAPDCFHLGRKGQAAAAVALWNNMVEKVQAKRTDWTPGEGLECPTEEHPYLYTKKNSIPNFT
ncbi:phospholipase B1, membrane-associated-like [Gigantopelta aegis]|uniref:phospholipase B1, membrane-associated-like n=1 Tax=Gigantopelta aegis TaxID=1735272 RepID=UPI001B88B08B|nr:phospholipase B1, membrane-associated-like [Gigantopelta aegis]